ncbi:MAG: MBL fold metallo-hydrolase [Eubacteriales bacterium]|nr:MBL fold metallo-hydrolase [Eubacteriales bacterium]
MGKRPNKPNLTPETIKNMEDMTFFTSAQIFDDLLIVAQKETACFVLKSSEGLIVIDAIWPCREAFEAIEAAIKEAGWDPNDIKKLVLTHGHVDHTGCGRWIVEKYGAKTYLSKIDDEFWQEHPTKPDRPETWKDYAIDVYVQDGDRIVCGDKTILVYSTPGHTPGCLSYIFPVTEDGVSYPAALWGGATPPFQGDPTEYLRSLEYFTEAMKKEHVEVILCNHTIFDNGVEKIAYSRKRLSYMPNLYLLGEEKSLAFCEVFRTLGEERMQRG